MAILDWLRGLKDKAAVAQAREDNRKTRGSLATKLVELDNARFHLDAMVRRSLELMEPKK